MYLNMNIIIFSLNVSVLDTFVQRLMIGLVTVRKLWIYSPAVVSEGKSYLSHALIQSMHKERGLFTDKFVVVRERMRAGQEGAECINVLHAALQ